MKSQRRKQWFKTLDGLGMSDTLGARRGWLGDQNPIAVLGISRTSSTAALCCLKSSPQLGTSMITPAPDDVVFIILHVPVLRLAEEKSSLRGE